VELGRAERLGLADDFGRRLVTFGIIGAAPTAVSLLIFLALAPSLGAIPANLVALGATFAANAWADARFTAHRRRFNWGRATAMLAGAAALSTASLGVTMALDAGPTVQLVVVLGSWLAASLARAAQQQRGRRPLIPAPPSSASSTWSRGGPT